MPEALAVIKIVCKRGRISLCHILVGLHILGGCFEYEIIMLKEVRGVLSLDIAVGRSKEIKLRAFLGMIRTFLYVLHALW